MHRQFTQLIIIYFSTGLYLFASGSYDFFNFPVDARSLALHNSASAYDGLLLNNNPASLSKHANGNTYSYFHLPANIHFTGFQNVHNSSSEVRANKISFMNYGTIIDAETENKSYAYDILLEYGFKKEIKKLTSVGLSVGYLLSSLAGYKSQLLYSNIGIRSRMLRKRLGVGFSLENIGLHLKLYTDAKEPIPALFRTALYYEPQYIPLIINGDFVTFIGDDEPFHFSGGIELKPHNRLTLRLGNSNHRRGYITNDFSSDIISGFSGGAGLRFTNMILDIGFMNLGPAGFIVGFSLIKNMD